MIVSSPNEPLHPRSRAGKSASLPMVVAALLWGTGTLSVQGAEGGLAPLPPDSSKIGANTTSAASSAQAVSAETTDRLQRSDNHFNKGRELYFEGDLAGARREFDAAVDALLSASEATAVASDGRRIDKRLDELCDLIYRFDLEKLGAGAPAQAEEAYDKAPIDEVSHTTFPVDPSIAGKLKSELTQTTSGIPLELSDPVLSYVHFYSTDRGREILLSGLRRSGRYRPMIERIFSEEGVPQELIYLAQAESGFLPRAMSYKRAVGMWQFISGTGATYDLVRTSTMDERLDPEKATRAAARFLRDLHKRYGDWYLAMAAYNCGAGAVDRAVERTGYADYWELLKRHALPRETSAYVPIIVAITIMAKNPQDYGLTDVTLDDPIQFETMQLSAATSMNLIADASRQPLSVIRDLNPAFLTSVIPAGYQVRVPTGAMASSMAAIERVPAENRSAWRIHHVETGDTLATIAQTYHVTANRLQTVNKLSSTLDRGDVLLIPAVLRVSRLSKASSARGRSGRNSNASLVRTRTRSKLRVSTHVAAARRLPAGVITHRSHVRPQGAR